MPTIGISFGISSIAELQIDGGLYNSLSDHRAAIRAPLASLLTVTGDTTHDVEDIVIATKIRIAAGNGGAAGVRLPLRDQAAERVERERPRPRHDRLLRVAARRQDRPVGPRRRQPRRRHPGGPDDRQPAERRADLRPVVRAGDDAGRRSSSGELNGRVSTRSGDPFPGTESRGILKFGGRYTHGPVRLDAAVVLRPDHDRSDDRLHRRLHLRVQRVQDSVTVERLRT